MEKNLIEALEKLEKMVSDKTIESYEIHREKETYNTFVSAIGSIEDYGRCEVSADLEEVDEIPQMIREELLY